MICPCRLPWSACLLLGALVPVLARGVPAQDAPQPTPEAAAPAASPAAPDDEAVDAWAWLAGRHDGDGDGRIERAEYARGEQAFARLDRDGDGVLTEQDLRGLQPSPEEQAQRDGLAARALVLMFLQQDAERDVLSREELAAALAASDADGDGLLQREELLSRIEAAGRRRPPPMVGMLFAGRDRAALLTSVVDGDGDGALSGAELLAWFDAHDPEATGRWTTEGLRRDMFALGPPGARRGPPGPEERRGPRSPGGARGPRGEGRRGDDPRASEATGLAVEGRPAPDFTLPREHGGDPLTLSSFAGDRPVALIFGSYT